MYQSNIKNSFYTGLTLIALCLFTELGHAQCAGSDATVTVCEKDTDTDNQDYELHDVLVGETLGGRWSTNDPANFFALNRTTGVVNLWRIKNSGQHEFIYTVDCGSGPESAIVTINLGGYPGEENIDGSADACGDDSEVNLFSYVGSEIDGLSQDFNGVWEAVTPEAVGFLDENIFNGSAAGVGTYEFTHTTPAVETCPARQIRLILEVLPPARSGTGTNLEVCITDDLSGLTNFVLNDILEMEDPDGTWSETITDQLDDDDLSDNVIDVEAIRDTRGYGVYPFVYTVFPEHPVCEKNETEVLIVILPSLQGTLEPADFCLDPDEYHINVEDYNEDLFPAGIYSASYTLTSALGVESTVIDTLNLRVDGTGYLEIEANLVESNETTRVEINSLDYNMCPNLMIPPVSFTVNDPSVEVTDICEGQDMSVTFQNIFDASSGPANGGFDVNYSITAPSGTITNLVENAVSFNTGNATFSVPSSELTETGDYTLSFSVSSGYPANCTTMDTATITPIPSAIDLGLIVDNSCNATQIDVTVDAPALTTGEYAITYDVTRQDTGEVVINNSINFAGGTATYDLDVASLDQGNYTVSVRSTQNDTTPCRIEFDFEESENFAIEGVPALPIAETEQTFCLSAFAPDGPTLADIDVTANGQIMFYATATDMDILALDTQLIDGEDYFVSNIDPNNNCEGSDRIQVTVSLANPFMPTVVDANPAFCGSPQPVVGDLDASVSSSGEIVWFENATGGTPLEASTPLIDGQSYFAATANDGQCLSARRTEVVATVYALEPASLQFADLGLCGLDNPTVADLEDAEGDNPFEVLWYDQPENGTVLSEDTLLLPDATYYAESFNPVTGCMNPARVAVTVDLSDCEPIEYGYFVPDGFSPNGDGRNDTFFIPNIEIIFPDFTLEILNRYGNTLFKGDRNNPAWDGDKSPNGVYFYIIDYNKEGFDPVQGRLYLNR